MAEGSDNMHKIDVMSLRNFFTSFLGTIKHILRKTWSKRIITSIPEDLVQTYSSNYLNGRVPRGVELRMPESGANANAVLICVIIHSIHPNGELEIFEDATLTQQSTWLRSERFTAWMGIFAQNNQHGFAQNDSRHGLIHRSRNMSNGEWVWMGIFTQQSTWLRSERFTACPRLYSGVEVKDGWILRGTEQSIQEAFHRLYTTFVNSTEY